MKKHFYTNICFQVIIIIALGLSFTALIQHIYSERIIERSILNSSKRQAYTYLLGIERQIQEMGNPLNPADLNQVFQRAWAHDIEHLDFAIINLFVYDRLGKVIAYLHEPKIMLKDLDGYHGEIFRTKTPYMGDTIREHPEHSQGKQIWSTDIITPIHFKDKIIGGLEVEIDLTKTFALVEKMDNRYESQIALMLVVTLLLLLGFIWSLMQLRIISPVKKIGQFTQNISQGDLKSRVHIESANEIGNLVESVNKMANNLEEMFNELDRTYLGTLNSLIRALEARDDYTASHSANVTRYSLELGRYIGLNEKQMETLEQGAMLHDLGKIGIPDDILRKDDTLNNVERDIIEQHPPLTSAILDPLEKFKHFSAIARHHHERWDGKGYPDGLSGENIPLLARIVSISDTWDAMTSDRVYRKGMNKEEALKTLEQERDSGQWDPYLVDQFVTLLRKKNFYELPSVDIAA